MINRLEQPVSILLHVRVCDDCFLDNRSNRGYVCVLCATRVGQIYTAETNHDHRHCSTGFAICIDCLKLLGFLDLIEYEIAPTKTTMKNAVQEFIERISKAGPK